MLIFLTYLLIHPTLLEQTNGMYLKNINDEEVAVVKTSMAPFSSHQGPFVVPSTCKIGSFLGSLSSHFSSGTALIPKSFPLSDLSL